ncbi:WXG100 family type VII secretion target [Streptomyces phaeofaciens]|uniref:WXG100 family type VII secretion target n=1 Tax=Streptomyces phaeofaciens TaxID=68254 RepID=UPI0036B41173
MSGDEKQPEYAAEHQEADQQNGTLDAVMNVTKVLPFGFGSGQGFHFGKTSFEGYDLNAMIDIVESANPELIEGAGNALVAARDAFNKAAEELSTNLGDIDWQGEAHTAFTTWGTDLVTTAYALATYADTVGTQVMAASSGLASVRKSMPPRDGRIDPKTVDEIPTPKRVEGNEEYAAAVKAESHRQEAINQMYRLASFYTVSGGMMQTAEEPVFPKMPDAGVPEPPPGYGDGLHDSAQSHTSLSTTHGSESTRHDSTTSGVARPHTQDLSSSQTSVDDSAVPPKQHIGTEIDSVGTLPPQDTTKPTPVTPPTTTTGGPPVGTNPPIGPVVTPPVARGQTGRTTGFGGGKGPVSAQGRTGGMQSGPAAGRTGTGPMGRGGMPGQAAGRTGGPMGRGGMPGQAAGRTGGPMGRGGMPGQAAGRTGGPMGRGVVGGTPKPGGPAAKQPGGVPRGPVNGAGAMNPGRNGAARPGVVGGKPVTGAGNPGANGSRVPRGNVIGHGGAPSSRTTGERPGQRGVIGANTSKTNAGQTPRRPVDSPDGVVGTPKGGAGAPRGRGGKQGSGETRSRREERRDGTSAND